MLTTVKNNDQKEKEKQRIKISKKITRNTRKKLRKKAITLLKNENVNTTSTRRTHTKFWNFKTESQTNLGQKRKTNKHISDKPKTHTTPLQRAV
jgi:hypothetical protein